MVEQDTKENRKRLVSVVMILEDKVNMVRNQMEILGDFLEEASVNRIALRPLLPKKNVAAARQKIKAAKKYYEMIRQAYDGVERAARANTSMTEEQMKKTAQDARTIFEKIATLEVHLADIRRALGVVEH